MVRREYRTTQIPTQRRTKPYASIQKNLDRKTRMNRLAVCCVETTRGRASPQTDLNFLRSICVTLIFEKARNRIFRAKAKLATGRDRHQMKHPLINFVKV